MPVGLLQSSAIIDQYGIKSLLIDAVKNWIDKTQM